MAYTPDPADSSQPIGSVKAKTAAAEFRALKAWIQTLAGLSGTPAGLTSLNSGPLSGFRNKAINGDFQFWQANTTLTSATSSYQYCADQWRHFGQAGGTGSATVSRQSHTVGQTDVFGEPQYYLRWNQTVAATGSVVLSQPIEDVRQYAGRTCTLSFYAKASAGRTLKTRLEQNFGGGGSASVQSATASHTLTTAWTKFTHTVTLASISGKTIGTRPFLDLQFVDDTNTTFDIQISQVQLEVGGAASIFEELDFATRLIRCQRYLEKSYPVDTALATATSTGSVRRRVPTATTDYIDVGFKVTKAAAPTMYSWSDSDGSGGTGASARVRDNTAGANLTATWSLAGDAYATCSMVSASVGTLMSFHWAADARF